MSGYGIKKMQASQLAKVHAVFFSVAVSIYNFTKEKSGLSAFLTLSAICQCWAIAVMVSNALSTRNVEGISGQSLKLQAASLGCRLSSTLWLLGYIPSDYTGNRLYQFFDLASLLMVLWLLSYVLQVQRASDRNVDGDDLPIRPFIVISFIVAAIFHANLDRNALFDTLWMCGLLIGAVSLMPQVWLNTRCPSKVPPVIGHFVGVTALSSLSSGYFFWLAFLDFTSKSYFTQWIGMCLSGHVVLCAHVFQLMLVSHVVYSQLRRLASRPLSLPTLDEVCDNLV